MAAANPVLRLPPPAQIAEGVGKITPVDLSKSPLLGILGVILGAGIVTLTGRMISLGLADLKGHLGISFDAGAWVGTTYDMALMFIGAFTVYLGGLIGPRRILLFRSNGIHGNLHAPAIHSQLCPAHSCDCFGRASLRHFLSPHS